MKFILLRLQLIGRLKPGKGEIMQFLQALAGVADVLMNGVGTVLSPRTGVAVSLFTEFPDGTDVLLRVVLPALVQHLAEDFSPRGGRGHEAGEYIDRRDRFRPLVDQQRQNFRFLDRHLRQHDGLNQGFFSQSKAGVIDVFSGHSGLLSENKLAVYFFLINLEKN